MTLIAKSAAWSRIIATLDAVRTQPDLQTERGRAQDRLRRVALSALASVLAKAITIIANLISIPLTLHYLGAERYGVWMVLSSFTLMLSFADMGLGNGVLNAIADSHGRDDRGQIRRTISGGYATLLGVGIAILVIFLAAYPFVEWYKIFNISGAAARNEAGPALFAFIVLFAFAIPLSLVQKIQIGLQQSFVASLWQCLGGILTLVALLVAIELQGSLFWLVSALVGAPLIASLLNTVVFFTLSRRDLTPKFDLVSTEIVRHMMRSGFLFFLIQIIASLAYGSDSLIIAQVGGASAVAQYAVPERMFAMVSMLMQMVLAPLWPAYGEAISRGDHAWVLRTLKTTIVIAAALSIFATSALVLLAPFLIGIWVGAAVKTSLILLLGLAAWRITEVVSTSLATFMNGAGILREQVIIALISGISMVALKIFLVQRIGVAGIPWAAVIAFVPLGTLPMAYVVARHLGWNGRLRMRLRRGVHDDA